MSEESKPDLLRQGWLGLALWMSFGLLLEGLLGFKNYSYLGHSVRREMFTLAHTHGTLLSLVLIAAAVCLKNGLINPAKHATLALRIGAVAMPLGFLLAGLFPFASDPGLAIFLVPLAALSVIYGAVSCALSAGNEKPPKV
jgi:hypothetical protein